MTHWRDTVVAPTEKIIDAVAVLDRVASQIILVADAEDRLLGTVTDGDVRRAILKGIPTDRPVLEIANPDPRVMPADAGETALLQAMKAYHIRHIPLVDADRRLVGLAGFDTPILPEATLPNAAVVMAGGKGTRLYPLTRDVPKPLLKLGGKPILELIVENLVLHGLRTIYLSVNYRADMIKDHFANGAAWGAEIRYLEEDRPLGTAGALRLLPEAPAEPLVVMNGDVLTDINFRSLLAYHREAGGAAMMAVHKHEIEVPYGVVEVADGAVERITEKPVQTFLVNAGIYVLNPDCLGLLTADERCDMPELFERIRARGETTRVFPIREYWLDIGRPDELDRARADIETRFGRLGGC